jgi:hypothetical protein
MAYGVPNKSGKIVSSTRNNKKSKMIGTSTYVMGVHDIDDIPPFIINLNSDSSGSESDQSTDLDEPSTSNTLLISKGVFW